MSRENSRKCTGSVFIFRCVCAAIFSAFAVCGAFAADTATFVDMGFSPDGKTYLFGQYGEIYKSAASFNGYAELYGINTTKNNFIAGGSQKIIPSYKTAGKSGSAVFNSLTVEKNDFISTYTIQSESNSVVLYQTSKGESADQRIEFRDFENAGSAGSYAVSLVELVEGKGADCSSSFYLLVEQFDTETVLKKRFMVGNPQIKRKGVSGYSIHSVLRDSAGKSIVFIIEKHLPEKDGTSVRFMAETAAL